MVNIILILLLLKIINSLIITELYKSESDCNTFAYPLMVTIYNMDTTGSCDKNLWGPSPENKPYFTTTCDGKDFNMTYWDDSSCTVYNSKQGPLSDYSDVCIEHVNNPGLYYRSRCDVQTYTVPDMLNRIWYKEYKNFDELEGCMLDGNMTYLANTYYLQALRCSKLSDTVSYYLSCSNNGQMGIVIKDSDDCSGPDSSLTVLNGIFSGGAVKTCIHDTSVTSISRYVEECNSAFSIFSGIVGFVMLCLFVMF